MLSEYRKGTGESMGKNDRGPQNLEDHSAQGMRIWRRDEEKDNGEGNQGSSYKACLGSQVSEMRWACDR